MSQDDPSGSSRREFLTGRALRTEIESRAAALGEGVLDGLNGTAAPMSGPTLRLGKRAMACDFDVILNPGPADRFAIASDALDLIDLLEDQLSVYRPHTELSQLNRTAAQGPVAVEARLFELLTRANRISDETGGGFDPTAGPLIALWRRCKSEQRIPTESELAAALELVGMHHLRFDAPLQTVAFDRAGVELNLGSIGKGYALDRAAEGLLDRGLDNWLLHGGQSSLLARGGHAGYPGWPIGIRNPLFPERQCATVLLCDRGLATSGSGVQHFRHGGKRYGHIVDPRTGWPVEGLLSATVLAPTAAEADAISTAFFVIGVEKAVEYCHNHKDVCALLIPAPPAGRRLQPINCGIPDELLFWSGDEGGT